MNEARAGSPKWLPPKINGEHWPRVRWLKLIALILAAHVALIFAFGERKRVTPRIVKNVPQLRLANHSDAWLDLNDPTLFALPNPRDFSSAVWLKTPQIKPPAFAWTEPPRRLQLAVENLGASFGQFMRTNFFGGIPLRFKPPARLSELILPIEPALAQHSTLQISGDLAGRRLLDKINLPSPPFNDVIAPSKVQVVVDAAGDVVSAILLPPENLLPSENNLDVVRDPAADQRALALARAVRFAPAPKLTVGLMIFNWQTVPIISAKQ